MYNFCANLELMVVEIVVVAVVIGTSKADSVVVRAVVERVVEVLVVIAAEIDVVVVEDKDSKEDTL